MKLAHMALHLDEDSDGKYRWQILAAREGQAVMDDVVREGPQQFSDAEAAMTDGCHAMMDLTRQSDDGTARSESPKRASG